MICKNCGNKFEGNFCNNCGQPAETHRIDVSFVAHDLRHGTLHIHGGLFYSAKELFTRPGHAIREYIEGKRIKHYKPISMLIVLATFYGLLYHTFNINVFAEKNDEYFDYNEINEWIAHHFSLLTIVQLPILSLSSYLAFRKQTYNYTEHIILNSFYSSQKIWLRILLLPFLILAKNTETVIIITQWSLLGDFILLLWCYGQFFKNLPKFKVFLLSLTTIIASTFIILILTTLVLYFIYR